MIFNIVRTSEHSIDGSHDRWNWNLSRGGNPFLFGDPKGYGSEDEVRSAIAVVKRAGSGMKFAKVDSPNKEEQR